MTIFSRILAGEIPCHRVFEDADRLPKRSAVPKSTSAVDSKTCDYEEGAMLFSAHTLNSCLQTTHAVQRNGEVKTNKNSIFVFILIFPVRFLVIFSSVCLLVFLWVFV